LNDKNKKVLTVLGVGAAISAIGIGLYMLGKRKNNQLQISVLAEKK
jgi:LPXTG-motif cell wall-anchored protein